MYWTTSSDLKQPRTLGIVEIPSHPDLALDLIEHSLFRLAILTVPGVYPPVTEPHLNALQRESFPLRIHAECHGRSRSKRDKQVFVGSGAAIGATKGFRLIPQEFVSSGFGLLGEPFPRHGSHNDF